MQQKPLNLGELELTILQYLWDQGPDDVKTAHRAVGVPRKITLNTVQSTMKRLWDKGLLDREKQGHAYVYSARVTRRDLTEMMVGELIEEVAGSQMEVALQAFVDVAEGAGDDTLDRLEKLVAARRGGDEE